MGVGGLELMSLYSCLQVLTYLKSSLGYPGEHSNQVNAHSKMSNLSGTEWKQMELVSNTKYLLYCVTAFGPFPQ